MSDAPAKSKRQQRIEADREAGATYRVKRELSKLARLASGIKDLDQLETYLKRVKDEPPGMRAGVRTLLISMMPKSRQRSFKKESSLIITDLSKLPTSKTEH